MRIDNIRRIIKGDLTPYLSDKGYTFKEFDSHGYKIIKEDKLTKIKLSGRIFRYAFNRLDSPFLVFQLNCINGPIDDLLNSLNLGSNSGLGIIYMGDIDLPSVTAWSEKMQFDLESEDAVQRWIEMFKDNLETRVEPFITEYMQVKNIYTHYKTITGGQYREKVSFLNGHFQMAAVCRIMGDKEKEAEVWKDLDWLIEWARGEERYINQVPVYEQSIQRMHEMLDEGVFKCEI